MKERPILFSGPMVRAILEGRKTQTRRVVKPQPNGPEIFPPRNGYPEWFFRDGYYACEENDIGNYVKCPYGVPGDRLWCRETFITGHPTVAGGDLDAWDEDGNEKPKTVWYAATETELEWVDDDGARLDNVPWKPSIHMPRWASRILLEVVSVRVERVQDISDKDARAEGFPFHPLDASPLAALDPVDWYAALWDSINGKKPGCTWADNPWVWVVEFRVIDDLQEKGKAA